LLLARARPERVGGIVGIAAAPDFTEDLVWQALTDAQKKELREKDRIEVEGLPLTLKFIEEGRSHLLLKAPLPITVPVHLLQGLEDQEVPWRYALRIAEHLASDDACVTLVKGADHRLSRPQDLALLWNTVQNMRERTAITAPAP
jgi:pimeloyl-ACP methyl ester carboxylesterase